MNECGGKEEREACPELDPAARARAVAVLLERGVFIPDPDRVYVDSSAEVGSGTLLLPGVHLRGGCKIGRDCRIGPDCWIEDSTIETGSIVWYSVLESARVREGTRVGPYAHLRPGADVGPEARVGNFVEVKAARLGRGAKAGHLAYIGDAEVGEGANIGAGAVTCNFDGVGKHRTVIEDGAFIGTNASLVAPVRIGKNAIVGAGSTITDDVPPGALALGRARQVLKDRSASEPGNEEKA
ncbi:MAG: DapH/DapD/GlmU-related protein [Candidatus Bipolaricaulia bacterium]